MYSCVPDGFVQRKNEAQKNTHTHTGIVDEV